MEIRATGVSCPSCGDMILERSYIPYIPAISADLLGPGSNNIATESDRRIHGYHCMSCMMDFHDLPSNKPVVGIIKATEDCEDDCLESE